MEELKDWVEESALVLINRRVTEACDPVLGLELCSRKLFCLVAGVMSSKELKDPNPRKNIVFRGMWTGLDEMNEKGEINGYTTILLVLLRER